MQKDPVPYLALIFQHVPAANVPAMITNRDGVPAALSGMADCYKIKFRGIGYRLVYRVDDEIVYVTVIAVGRRDKAKPGVYLKEINQACRQTSVRGNVAMSPFH